MFVDCDIGCPVPDVPESSFGNLNWFLTFARYSRLLSRALTSLFSIGVTGNPDAYYLAAIDQLGHELERWRTSVPADFRPGEPEPLRARKLLRNKTAESLTMQAACWTHYLYCSFRLVLSRATLQLAAQCDGLVTPSRQAECKKLIMETSRSILELTALVDVEPYTPLWSDVMPLKQPSTSLLPLSSGIPSLQIG